MTCARAGSRLASLGSALFSFGLAAPAVAGGHSAIVGENHYPL